MGVEADPHGSYHTFRKDDPQALGAADTVLQKHGFTSDLEAWHRSRRAGQRRRAVAVPEVRRPHGRFRNREQPPTGRECFRLAMASVFALGRCRRVSNVPLLVLTMLPRSGRHTG